MGALSLSRQQASKQARERERERETERVEGSNLQGIKTRVRVTAQKWWETNQDALRQHYDQSFVCRYVDNRLVVYSEQIEHQPWLQKVGLLAFVVEQSLKKLSPVSSWVPYCIQLSDVLLFRLQEAQAVNSRVCLASRCSYPQSQKEQVCLHAIFRRRCFGIQDFKDTQKVCAN